MYLHSLRFSGEVRLLKNSKFENLLSEGSLSVVVSCVDTRVALPFEFTPLYISCVFNFCPAIFFVRVCLVVLRIVFLQKGV